MSGGSLATIVLAAGAGTRFGGRKLLASVEGRPLLERVLEVLDAVGERRIVVLGAAAEEVEGAVPGGWQVVFAPEWERGPGASLRAGLEAVPQAEAALVVLADLAWLQREAIDRVLAAAASAPAAVEAFRACEGDVPGHPVLIRGRALVAARAAPDEGLRPLLGEREVKAVECSGLGVGRDVDTAADLRGD